MRAIELNLENVLFTVSEDKISINYLTSIERNGGDVVLKMGSYNSIKCDFQETKAVDVYKTYYFTLDEAQKAQLELRQKRIEERFAEMQKAQSQYNYLISSWFNKPAHDPYEKEVKDES